MSKSILETTKMKMVKAAKEIIHELKSHLDEMENDLDTEDNCKLLYVCNYVSAYIACLDELDATLENIYREQIERTGQKMKEKID